jgi:hypothetical protein
MTSIKSSYDIAMEKMKNMGLDDSESSLSTEQKNRVAEIKKEYKAKIAEKEILLKGDPHLYDEIKFLEQERDKKIKAIRDEAGSAT